LSCLDDWIPRYGGRCRFGDTASPYTDCIGLRRKFGLRGGGKDFRQVRQQVLLARLREFLMDAGHQALSQVFVQPVPKEAQEVRRRNEGKEIEIAAIRCAPHGLRQF